MTPGQTPPPTPGRNTPPPPTPGRNTPPPPDPRLDPPPPTAPPPPRVLKDSWGVGRIRTGCSHPPPVAQNNHIMPRDTTIHTYTFTWNYSTAEGSRTIIPVARFMGYGGRSSTGALLSPTKGLASLLLSHSKRWDSLPRFAH